MNKPNITAPLLIVAQFLCTSVWFASNTVIDQIQSEYHLPDNSLTYLTMAIQFGFILGTFLYAIFGISDRFSPSIVFFLSAIGAAICNMVIVAPIMSMPFASVILYRACTGVFLAGIYPVGLKIAADHFGDKLYSALGWIVGALVLGTAFPFLLGATMRDLHWHWVMYGTTMACVAGGIIVLFFVPDGPFRQVGQKFQARAIPMIFKEDDFKRSAFGYFGHMWELYTFWTLVPILVAKEPSSSPNLLTFSIIGIGAVGCVLSGYLASTWTVKRTAIFFLASSLICSLAYAIAVFIGITSLILPILFLWGFTVIPDSPMFSTLVARHAPSTYKGTALTLINGIGFMITILSIKLITWLMGHYESAHVVLLLALGPVIGLVINRSKS